MSGYNQITNYILKEDIGEGNFGKVKLAIYKETKEKFAIKILNKEQIRIKMKNTIFQENDIITKFNHINVIFVFAIIEDSDNYYIVMEYCKKGELFDYIVAHQYLSEEESSIFFYQLINGVDYIHSKGIAHRDLKPENLLLTENKILKIIDFGLSHEFNEGHFLLTKCGSPSYASPEIIKGTEYDGFKTDIWCCGIILYAMVCGYLPFEGENNDILFKNIVKCEPEIPDYLSNECQEIIRGILKEDPMERITIDGIKKSKFYLKGKKLCNIDYYMVEKNIIQNRIINKNQEVKNKIKKLKVFNKDKEANAFRKKLINLVADFNIKLKEKKQNHPSILQTDFISKNINKFNYIKNNNSNISESKNKKKFSLSPYSIEKKDVKTLKRGGLKLSPKYSFKDLIESKKQKKNIPYITSRNNIYNNINMNINHFYFNGFTKSSKGNYGSIVGKIYLSKKKRGENSPSDFSISNNYDTVIKKNYNVIMNNMTNFQNKHNKQNSETISGFINISNYTNPNLSNFHNRSISREEKIISRSSKRNNYLPVLKHHFL